MPTNLLGLMNQSSFKLNSLDPPNSNNSLPLILQVQAYFLGTSINTTLYQIQGLASNNSLSNKVFMRNITDSRIVQIKTENLVSYIIFI